MFYAVWAVRLKNSIKGSLSKVLIEKEISKNRHQFLNCIEKLREPLKEEKKKEIKRKFLLEDHAEQVLRKYNEVKIANKVDKGGDFMKNFLNKMTINVKA